MGHLDIPKNVTLIHYIDNIMLIGPEEEEEDITFQALVCKCTPDGGMQTIRFRGLTFL